MKTLKSLTFRPKEEDREFIKRVLVPLWLAALDCEYAIVIRRVGGFMTFTFVVEPQIFEAFQTGSWLYNVLFDASMEFGLCFDPDSTATSIIIKPAMSTNNSLLGELYTKMGLDPDSNAARPMDSDL